MKKKKEYKQRGIEIGFLPMFHDGRENRGSSINSRKRRLVKERGEFFREEFDWEEWEKDKALDGYLYRGWYETNPSPNVPTFQSEMGRTFDSIFTMLRKLATRHPEVGDYISGIRQNREGLPWTERDYRLMNLALNKTGVANGANLAVYIARLLARSEKEVMKELKRLGRLSELTVSLVRKRRA